MPGFGDDLVYAEDYRANCPPETYPRVYAWLITYRAVRIWGSELDRLMRLEEQGLELTL